MRARAFLAALIQRGVTSAAVWASRQPNLTLNVSLSFGGLQAAEALSPAGLDEFPFDFQVGPNPERLHDLGPSAVWWNGVAVQRLHCLVTLHAQNMDLNPTFRPSRPIILWSIGSGPNLRSGLLTRWFSRPHPIQPPTR